MGKESYRKIRQEAKDFYMKIGSLSCPALNGNVIHFNNVGFNHILRKGNDIRPITDQIRRFKLIPNTIEIIQNGVLKDYRIIMGKQKIEFWTISSEIGGRELQVTIIGVGNGQKKFLSIAQSN